MTHDDFPWEVWYKFVKVRGQPRTWLKEYEDWTFDSAHLSQKRAEEHVQMAKESHGKRICLEIRFREAT